MDQPTLPSNVLVYLNQTVPCYASLIYNENGIWKGPNPLVDILPLFVVQLTVAVLTTRIFILLFKPFNLPRFVAEVIAGIFLGPTVLGNIDVISNKLFPNGGFLTLDPMAHFALIQYTFLMGLKMDLTILPTVGKRALSVALCGFLIPLVVGTGLFFMYGSNTDTDSGFLFWATALTVTGYPDLAKMLQRLRILDTDVGKKALYSTLISDILSWSLFALAISLSSDHVINTVWTTLAMMAFVFAAKYQLRPGLSWVVRQVPEGHEYSEFYLCSVLVGAFISGLLTDAFGTHPIVGAFVFGLAVPKGELEALLVEKLDVFVKGLMMPIFFVACGHRMNIFLIGNVAMAILVIVLACLAKALSAFLESFFYEVPILETLRLGVLMSSKSVFAMVVLYVGIEQKALSNQNYTVIVVAILLMTVLVNIIMCSGKKKIRSVPYKQRTLQRAKPNEDLHILACVHSIHNVAPIVSLLEASYASTQSILHVYPLHLVEQIGHSSAANVVQSSAKSFTKGPNQVEADQIITSFEEFAGGHDFIDAQPLILRAAYASMDEYVCEVLEEKRCSLVVLPFHLQQNTVGEMEDMKPAIREFNENMLANAPCSVGLLIDRGLARTGEFPSRVAMLYVGGPDDREALAYAMRMSRHPNVTLSVIRFVPSPDTSFVMEPMTISQGMLAVNIENASEKELDEAFINKFKEATKRNKAVEYVEMELENEEDTVKAIRSMDHKFDLFVVGRGRGVTSPLTSGLADWCDCPELGAIGDALVTSEFSSAFAVVVVQQYVLIGGTPSSSSSFSTISSVDFTDGGQYTDTHGSGNWTQPQQGGDHSDFVNSPARNRDI